MFPSPFLPRQIRETERCNTLFPGLQDRHPLQELALGRLCLHALVAALPREEMSGLAMASSRSQSRNEFSRAATCSPASLCPFPLGILAHGLQVLQRHEIRQGPLEPVRHGGQLATPIGLLDGQAHSLRLAPGLRVLDHCSQFRRGDVDRRLPDRGTWRRPGQGSTSGCGRSGGENREPREPGE